MRRRLVLLSLVVIGAPLWLAPVLAQKFWEDPSAKPAKRAVAELQVGHETALPGAIVQIKLFLTEPKPISTGLFDVAGEFGELAGVGVFSPSDDAYAVAWPTAGGIRLAAISTVSAFGLGQSDYPILTLAVHVPATAAMGAVLPVRIDPAAITLLGPNGSPYTVSVRDGSVTVGTMPSVEEVVPGSAEVPAGGTITILGRDMNPGTRVQVDEALTSQVFFVDPGRVEVTVSAPIVMHGREIKLRLKGQRSSYFSYQRTTDLLPSGHPALHSAEPAFPGPGVARALVGFPSAATDDLRAIALQNVQLEPAAVTLVRTCALGTDTIDLLLPPASRVVRALDELFGSASPDACEVIVDATQPIGVMGLIGDGGLSRLRLLPPR